MEELLRILEKNARMPIEDIAAMLDKTPEEIAAMMDEAAAKGYIRGYETLVDWEQAGVNLVEAVIELRVTPHKARWTTCSPPRPALCCAPTSAAVACTWPKNPMKESVPSCDELR